MTAYASSFTNLYHLHFPPLNRLGHLKKTTAIFTIDYLDTGNDEDMPEGKGEMNKNGVGDNGLFSSKKTPSPVAIDSDGARGGGGYFARRQSSVDGMKNVDNVVLAGDDLIMDKMMLTKKKIPKRMGKDRCKL
ncbi:hypothetical protein KSS87_015003 [Heliosperma pusillum]|nr:hypothetical protein KSS87_015003 [Heliosperma pusillum]